MSIEINGLIPFEMKGDLGKFETAYIPYFVDKGLSVEDARNIVSSIWHLANNEWNKGRIFGMSDYEPDTD